MKNKNLSKNFVPFFYLYDTHNGSLWNEGFYKEVCVPNLEGDETCFRPVAYDYQDGVKALHEYIEECKMSYRTCQFHLKYVDGTLDKWGELNRETVYKVSSKKAKLFFKETTHT